MKYNGKDMRAIAVLRPRTPIEVSGLSHKEIVCEIFLHRGIPTREKLARELNMRSLIFGRIVAGNPVVRRAWHEKLTSEVEKLSLRQLLDSKIAKSYRDVPDAVELRTHRILEFIKPKLSTFNGPLSFLALARHVAPKSHSKEARGLLSEDPKLRKVAEARFLEILNLTSAKEIKRRALHRNAAAISDKLKKVALDKLTAAGIPVKLIDNSPLS